MAARRDPVAAILEGLVAAIVRHGSRKVSMADVCEEAGVSRGTLYRYFPTREALFAALGTYTLDLYRRFVKEAVEADPDPARRIEVVVAALTGAAGEGAAFRRLFTAEPQYLLHYLRTNWDEMVGVLQEALAPAFVDADGAAVAADVLGRHLLARQLVRSDHTGPGDLVAVLRAYADRSAAP